MDKTKDHEQDGFKKIHNVERYSRHNVKTQLNALITQEDWEELEREFYNDETGTHCRQRH